MENKIKNFRDLDVWKLGKEIALNIYKITKEFPKEELYGLVIQVRRAAVSIPSNISEGFNRFHNNEYRHFLYMALGSCAELETQIEIGFQLEYMEKTQYNSILENLNHESRMLRDLIKKRRFRI